MIASVVVQERFGVCVVQACQEGTLILTGNSGRMFVDFRGLLQYTISLTGGTVVLLFFPSFYYG
jgi:hypothetical protein